MKNVLYTKDLRFRASFEVRREGNFLNFLVNGLPRGRPFGGGGYHT
jgi:hypothetical protein